METESARVLVPAAHTPGPWRLDHDRENKLTIRADVAGRLVPIYIGQHALTFTGHLRYQPFPAEDLANARLLAGAPTLLAVLQAICAADEAKAHHTLAALLPAARAAIAEVEGR